MEEEEPEEPEDPEEPGEPEEPEEPEEPKEPEEPEEPEKPEEPEESEEYTETVLDTPTPEIREKPGSVKTADNNSLIHLVILLILSCVSIFTCVRIARKD